MNQLLSMNYKCSGRCQSTAQQCLYETYCETRHSKFSAYSRNADAKTHPVLLCGKLSTLSGNRNQYHLFFFSNFPVRVMLFANTANLFSPSVIKFPRLMLVLFLVIKNNVTTFLPPSISNKKRMEFPLGRKIARIKIGSKNELAKYFVFFFGKAA